MNEGDDGMYSQTGRHQRLNACNDCCSTFLDRFNLLNMPGFALLLVL